MMATLSMIMKIVYLLLEALKFKSTLLNFHIIFPVVVDGDLIFIQCSMMDSAK